MFAFSCMEDRLFSAAAFAEDEPLHIQHVLILPADATFIHCTESRQETHSLRRLTTPALEHSDLATVPSILVLVQDIFRVHQSPLLGRAAGRHLGVGASTSTLTRACRWRVRLGHRHRKRAAQHIDRHQGRPTVGPHLLNGKERVVMAPLAIALGGQRSVVDTHSEDLLVPLIVPIGRGEDVAMPHVVDSFRLRREDAR